MDWATTTARWAAVKIIGDDLGGDPLPARSQEPNPEPPRGAVTFEVTCVVVAVGGLAVWLRVVRQAWRANARPVLVLALLPAPVVVVWFGGTGLVTVIGRHFGATSHRIGTSFGPSTAGAWALLSIFGIFTVVCVAICSGSTIAALSRARLPARLLSATAMTAAAVATALAAITIAAAVCLVKVLIVGGLDGVGIAMAVLPVAILAVASASALTSTTRGLHVHTVP